MTWPVGAVEVKASFGDCSARSAERSGVVSQRLASFCAREGRGRSAKAESRTEVENLTCIWPPRGFCGRAYSRHTFVYLSIEGGNSESCHGNGFCYSGSANQVAARPRKGIIPPACVSEYRALTSLLPVVADLGP